MDHETAAWMYIWMDGWMDDEWMDGRMVYKQTRGKQNNSNNDNNYKEEN